MLGFLSSPSPSQALLTPRRRQLNRCGLRRPNAPRCTAAQPPSPAREPHPALLAVERRLIDELPTLFTSPTPDYSIYSPSVTFEDPLNKFRGTARYRANIRLLTASPLFTEPRFALHDSVARDGRPGRAPLVRTRWTLTLCFAAAPWRPRPAFTGQSDYEVDLSSGLVTRHVDYWDSLDPAQNAFFSPAGLADFVAQCAPANAVPDSLPPFELLRRTRDMQIWRFDEDVALVPADDPATWAVLPYPGEQAPDAAVAVNAVAVVRIGDSKPSEREVKRTSVDLRQCLRDVPYAEPSEAAYRVAVQSGRHIVHYIFLPLSQASAPVDFDQY